MWLGPVSLILSSHCLLMARRLWQFIWNSFWDDRRSVASHGLPHSWHRLVDIWLSTTVRLLWTLSSCGWVPWQFIYNFYGSIDSVACPCLPRPWHFLFCRLALSSGLPIVLWYGPGRFRRLSSCPTLTHVRELQAISRCVSYFWRLSLFCYISFLSLSFLQISFLAHS